MQEWLKSNPVDGDDMLRHDKWMCMMWPRLKMLRELLAEGGLIAITIDNNELTNLWEIMIELFGENGFVACAPWLSEPSGGKEKTGLRTGHEYVLIFSKGASIVTQQETTGSELTLKDKHGPYAKGRELRKWGGVSLRSDREGQWFPLQAPDGSKVWPFRNDGEEGHWRWGSKNKEMLAILADPEAAHWEERPYDSGVVVQGKKKRWVPYEKVRTEEKLVGWKTWLDRVGYNADGTRVLKEIFGSKVFDTPKPVSLIKWVIGLLPHDSAVVLDSFAGSGTTAHAVLELNEEDGGDRKFILVEAEDYADRITAERVRRVIKGYKFTGVEKKELFRKRLNVTALKGAEKLLAEVESVEKLEGQSYDQVRKEIQDGDLVVIGEKEIKSKREGLGGSFTFCTLGDPLDIDSLLTGNSLPDYATLGSWLFHTATGEPIDSKKIKESAQYLGESKDRHLWLLYKPDAGFLQSPASALTLDLAQAIAKRKKDKAHLIFATAKFVPNREIHALNVEYAPLPFALYRVAKT
jgi:adenine-specific DNA-methyltransferase